MTVKTYVETNESKKFFDEFARGNNIFLTGKAGTGKSYLVKKLVEDNPDKEFIKIAPTGVAAVNIGGMTIHRFLGMGIGMYSADKAFPIQSLEKIRDKTKEEYFFKDVEEKLAERFANVCIILDEVSMARVDTIDILNASLRRSTELSKLFGGVQMVFVGDPFQLPPILNDEYKTYADKYYSYKSQFFFHSNAWMSGDFKTVSLKKIFRQDDDGFKVTLNNIRVGSNLDLCLSSLNERFLQDIGESYVTLCSTNKLVAEYNKVQYDKLPGQEEMFTAITEGDIETTPVDKYLTLKPETQVMIRVNAPDLSYYNGTMGIYKGLDTDGNMIIHEIGSDNIHYVGKTSWKSLKPDVDNEGVITNNETGKFTQYPVIKARAITINKSQGLTFDHIRIDTGRGLFAEGQGYVALSRCTSLEGISLARKLKPKDIMVSEHVIGFFNNLID